MHVVKCKYIVDIQEPKTHLVDVKMEVSLSDKSHSFSIFLPSWSPGSYLMREYARHIKEIKVEDSKGNRAYLNQVTKSEWRVDLDHPEFKLVDTDLVISYSIFCHELTVRTSHVDNTHAFLHGPSVFMGLKSAGEMYNGESQIEFKMNPLWSKLTTALKDISTKRDIFIYEASSYDVLLDSPFEIGCHETDGFMHASKEHHVAFYGDFAKVDKELKDDMQKIVEETASIIGEIPYDHYYFITHLAPGTFGGLEHLDSTVLQFCPFELAKKKGRNEFLELVAHEYFHLWNVKRIRPSELGPFDYENENYTRMHWLTEGLTSFVDQLITYRAGFYDEKSYLECIKKNINNYQGTPGRGYHSLETSSFNAWVKLYRAGENFKNSSVSYYLKGGLVFFVLNILLKESGTGINDLINALWNHYKVNPEIGITKDEFFQILEAISSKEVSDEFLMLVEGVDEIDFEAYLNRLGVEVKYKAPKLDLGITYDYSGGMIKVKSVRQGSCGYRSGINAGDEIIAFNALRVNKSVLDGLGDIYQENDQFDLLVARSGKLQTLTIVLENGLREISELSVKDEDKFKSYLR